MSQNETELVIRISTSDALAQPPGTPASKTTGKSALLEELKHSLQPGAVIALTYRDYVAMTSVVWLTEAPEENCVRAGVRLLGISARRQQCPAKAHDDADPMYERATITLAMP